MRLLLDTHILIWASAGTLPAEAVPFIADKDNILLFSSASIWEVMIKDPFDRLLVAQSLAEGIPLLTADAAVAQYKGKIISIQK